MKKVIGALIGALIMAFVFWVGGCDFNERTPEMAIVILFILWGAGAGLLATL